MELEEPGCTVAEASALEITVTYSHLLMPTGHISMLMEYHCIHLTLELSGSDNVLVFYCYVQIITNLVTKNDTH